MNTQWKYYQISTRNTVPMEWFAQNIHTFSQSLLTQNLYLGRLSCFTAFGNRRSVTQCSELLSKIKYIWDACFFNFYWLFVNFKLCISVLSISLPPAFDLCPCNLPTNKIKFKRKTKNQTKKNQKERKEKKNPVMEAVVWPSASHSSPSGPFLFTFKCWL